MKKLLLIITLLLPTLAEEYFYEFGEKVYLKEESTRDAIKDTKLRYFQTAKGHHMATTGDIILKLQSFDHLNYFLKNYPIESYKKLDQRTFLLTPQSGHNLFEIANRIHLDSMSIYAQPNFIRKQRGKR